MTLKTKMLPKRLTPTGTIDQYYDKLKKEGYKKIGEGMYASVWAKNKEHVIKVAVGDDGYDEFLSYALAYQDNPFFPKIYDVQRYLNVDDGWGWHHDVTVVKMERLTRAKQAQGTEISNRIKQVAAIYPYTLGSLPPNSKDEMIAGRVIAELNASRGSDLHYGNVMLRGKQTVITDPVT